MPQSPGPFMFGQEARPVLIHQPLFHFVDRQHVAVPNDQIDVRKRDAFGVQAIVDDLLIESGGVLFTRDAFLGDGERDDAIAQQACADVMVIDVQAEDVAVLL
jgi:hypothetical protein